VSGVSQDGAAGVPQHVPEDGEGQNLFSLNVKLRVIGRIIANYTP
jgi:hypothetical protein